MTSPPVIQTSFNSGEWAPALNARVDLAKYKSGAALLRNFFVDYRGGATTRPGTAYIARASSANTERLIPFQASFLVSYILEFFGGAIRFINNGKPVVETGIAVTGTTTLNPLTLSVANTYVAGDRVLISGIVGLVAPSGQEPHAPLERAQGGGRGLGRGGGGVVVESPAARDGDQLQPLRQGREPLQAPADHLLITTRRHSRCPSG